MLIRSSRNFLFAALGVTLLTVATRLPLLSHPKPISDEGIYSVVANEIVDGGRLYIDAVDRKPPFLFWTYALVVETAGKFNWKALHVIALVWTLCTMAGLYVIGRELFDRATGLIAALFYSVFQPWATPDNMALNGELMMNLPIAWAWAIAFRQSPSRLRPELLAAGALLCAAFLLKQPAAIAAVPLGIYLLLPSYRTSRGLSLTQSLIHTVMLTGGFFISLGLVAIALWKQGILREAIYWTIGDHTVPRVFWQHGILLTLAFVGACLPLVLGAAMASRDKHGVWVKRRAERTALLGLLLASAIGTASGARFFPHYYIQLIPPLALLAAPHYARLWSGTIQARFWLLRPRVTYAWLALTVIAFSIEHWRKLASDRKPTEAGRYLLEHSAPDDRIFVWGQAWKVYVDSQRRPASRYIGTYPLTGYVFSGAPAGLDTRKRILPGAWALLEQDFAAHPPMYILESLSEGDKRYPVRDFPIFAKLLADRYQPVAQTAEGVIYRMHTTRAQER